MKLRYMLQDLLRGLPAVSPLSAIVALRQPKFLPVFHANVLRSYRIAAGGRAPSVLAHQLIPPAGVVTMRLGEYGLFPKKEVDYPILELVAIQRPARVFEIGTSTGRRTSLIAMNTPDDGQIFTLDLPTDAASAPTGASDLHLIEQSKDEVGKHFRTTPWMGTKIHQLFGNSKTFDFSPYYDSIDFMMVDGSHTYEFVESDTLNAFRMVRDEGVILWHDYESERSEYGVNRFLDRLRSHHDYPIVRLSSEHGDTRFAAMRIDTALLAKIRHLAANPSSF